VAFEENRMVGSGENSNQGGTKVRLGQVRFGSRKMQISGLG